MTTRYYVDRAMLGDGSDDIDLTAFCRRLSIASGVDCIPVLDSYNGARNDDPDLIDDATWHAVLDSMVEP